MATEAKPLNMIEDVCEEDNMMDAEEDEISNPGYNFSDDEGGQDDPDDLNRQIDPEVLQRL